MTRTDEHVFYSWSAQDKINPVEVVSGHGSTVVAADGTEYLDFSSQLVFTNLGYQNQRLIDAIKRQADTLTTIAPAMANATRSELARRIAEAAPGDLNYVFFTNGGTEANENAVRLARAYTGKRKVLSLYRSYHGATGTSISLTGETRRWGNEPVPDGSVVHFFGPYPYRSQFYAETPEQECERALEHLEETILMEGPDTIGAIIMETVVGTNGTLIPPGGYLPGVRELCDRYNIMMICDEVMVGFGRTGTLFAVENFDVVPDMLTFAKGVNSGYVPLGGVIMSKKVRDTFAEKPFTGGLTYSGHPLACAPGVETFKIFEEEKILDHVRDLEERVMKPALAELRAKHEIIGDVRGLGMFYCLELVKDRETREQLVPFAANAEQAKPINDFAAACKKRGLWPMVNTNRVHIAPPLVITEDELRRGIAIIDEALTEIEVGL